MGKRNIQVQVNPQPQQLSPPRPLKLGWSARYYFARWSYFDDEPIQGPKDMDSSFLIKKK